MVRGRGGREGGGAEGLAAGMIGVKNKGAVCVGRSLKMMLRISHLCENQEFHNILWTSREQCV